MSKRNEARSSDFKWMLVKKGLENLIGGGARKAWKIVNEIKHQSKGNQQREKERKLKRKREEEMAQQTVSQSGFSGQFTQNFFGPHSRVGGPDFHAGGSGGRGEGRVQEHHNPIRGRKSSVKSQSGGHRSGSYHSTGATEGAPVDEVDSAAAPPKRQRKGDSQDADKGESAEAYNPPPREKSRVGIASTGVGSQADAVLTELPHNALTDGDGHQGADDRGLKIAKTSPLGAAHARRAAAQGVLAQTKKDLASLYRAGASRAERDAVARVLEKALRACDKADEDVDAEVAAALVKKEQEIRERWKISESKGQTGNPQVVARGHSGGGKTTTVVDKAIVPDGDSEAVDNNRSESAATRAPTLPAPFHSLGSRSSGRGACLEDEEEEESEGGFELALQQQIGRTSKHVKFDKQDDVINTKDDHDQTEGKDIRKATNPPFGCKQQGKATDSEATDDTTAALQHYPYHSSFERTTAPKPKLATAMPPVRAKLNPNAPAFVPKALLPAQSEPAKPGNSSTVPPSKLPAVKTRAFSKEEDVNSGSQPGPDGKEGLMTSFPSQAPPRPSPPGRPLPTPTSKEEQGPDYTQNKINGGLSTAPAVEQLTSKVITDSHVPAEQSKSATKKEETTADVIEELEHGFDDIKDGLEESHSPPRRPPSGRNVPNPIKEPLRAKEKQASNGGQEMTSAPMRPPVTFSEPHEPAAKLGDAKKSPAGASKADDSTLQLHDSERKDDQRDAKQNQRHSVVKKDINEVVTETQKIGAGLTLQHTSAGESAVGRETIQNESLKTNKEQKVAGSVSGSNTKKAVEAMKMETITSGELPEEQQAGSLATPTTSSGVPGTPFDPWGPMGVEQWSDNEEALVPYSDSSDAEVSPPKTLSPTPPPANDRGLDTAGNTGKAVRAETPVPFRSGGIGRCGVGKERTQASGARQTGEEAGAGKLAGDSVGLGQLLSFTTSISGNEARGKKVFDNKLYEDEAKQGDH
ncbi:hypothetical protein KFL_002260010 [Klebsormidium nitens]|uniref:Uncharacterized protein n=1 Tax=Klebsormidium nitens TaxID=105231 RepID=A0A1Y1I2T2_KLENI|nr:hypothetical protein KFL_002260010 [Klebsormidium nitens]|eukprot:GAQ85245.1 hypothetical protein KFL_002260010 [Klebsormidium nitens]